MSEAKQAEPEVEGEATPPAGKANKKKLIILAAAGALLLGGGGGGAFMLLHKPAAAAPGEEEAAAEKPKAKKEAGGEGEKKADYIDVPPMIVNLRVPDGSARFLKLHVMLVPGEDAVADDIKNRLPALVDGFQPFLRELRPEDLAGAAAVFRIKEELLARSVTVFGDGKVTDVLIQDLIQQ